MLAALRKLKGAHKPPWLGFGPWFLEIGLFAKDLILPFEWFLLQGTPREGHLKGEPQMSPRFFYGSATLSSQTEDMGAQCI